MRTSSRLRALRLAVPLPRGAGAVVAAAAMAALLEPGMTRAWADDVPPPPPPPRRGLAGATAGPSAEAALLGDLSESKLDGAERVIAAVGGIKQPVWVKLPGFEIRCDAIVLWGHKDRLDGALRGGQVDGKRSGDLAPRDVLGPVLHAVYAEGSVFVKRDTHVIRAERCFLDFAQNKAWIVDATIEGNRAVRPGHDVPMILRAKHVRGLAEGRYAAEDASFTACSYDHPHLEFTTSDLTVDFADARQDFETAWWPTVRADTPLGASLPVLAIPKLGGALGDHPVQTFEYSTSNRYGVTLGLGFGGKIKEEDGTVWGTWQVLPRYRSARGAGLDFELDHEHRNEAGGVVGGFSFDGTYQFDHQRDDDFSGLAFDGTPGGRSQNDRGEFSLRFSQDPIAQSLLGARSHLDGQVQFSSDRGFLAEYDADRAMTGDTQETFVRLHSSAGAQAGSLLFSYRIQDEASYLLRDPFLTTFAQQTEYLPSASYHVINLPLLSPDATGLFPVNFSAEATAGLVDRRYDEDVADVFSLLGWKSEDVLRGTAAARITAPFEVGAFQVTPAFGGSLYAVDDANGFGTATGLDDDGQGRSSAFAGLRIGTEFHRTWADACVEALDLRGIRHVVSTDVHWFNRFSVSDEGAGQFQLNDLQDALSEQNVVSWRLRNRFQTKRDGELVDWLDVESRFLWRAKDLDEAPGSIAFGVREEFAQPLDRLDFPGEDRYFAASREGSAYFQNRLRMQLLRNVWLMGESDHDMQANRTETSAAGMRWFLTESFSTYVGRRTIKGDSAIWTFRGDWRLSEKWGVGLEFQEDTKADRGLRSRLSLFRRSHDFTIAVEFESERLLDESGIGLAIYPHDWLVSKDDPFSRRRPLDYAAQRWYR
ncbi:MAG: LPS-assembly protein LptD [Planctomycetes bacterium]|nr:LPS-assembly protein LptD [Planctomycetota bacterium]